MRDRWDVSCDGRDDVITHPIRGPRNSALRLCRWRRPRAGCCGVPSAWWPPRHMLAARRAGGGLAAPAGRRQLRRTSSCSAGSRWHSQWQRCASRTKAPRESCHGRRRCRQSSRSARPRARRARAGVVARRPAGRGRCERGSTAAAPASGDGRAKTGGQLTWLNCAH